VEPLELEPVPVPARELALALEREPALAQGQVLKRQAGSMTLRLRIRPVEH
jgi:hypothetical protein